MTDLARQPAPGPWRPVDDTPELAVGAVRRTTSTDMLRSGGFLAPVVVDVRARDARRGPDGRREVIGEVELQLEVDNRTGLIVAVDGPSSTEARPVLEGLDTRRGLGRSLVAAMPDQAAERSLLFSVLEDLNGALLVSGYAPLRQGLLGVTGDGPARAEAQQDVCAGWAVGGPIVELLRAEGETAVPYGPPAPDITGGDRWHAMATPPVGTVRRVRCLDVGAPEPALGGQAVRAHFRDSYVAEEGEMVMHEYLVEARVDGSTPTLAAVEVEARVLPWRACPAAVPSAGALVGVRVEELPGRVRAELVGPSTCTHLNSTMRTLADVHALLTVRDGVPS